MANTKKETRNVKMSYKGGKLHLTVDVESILKAGDVVESDSGKSWVIASTHGFDKLTATGMEDVSFSLNVVIPKKKYTPELWKKNAQPAPAKEEPKKEATKTEAQAPAQTQASAELISTIVAQVIAQLDARGL